VISRKNTSPTALCLWFWISEPSCRPSSAAFTGDEIHRSRPSPVATFAGSGFAAGQHGGLNRCRPSPVAKFTGTDLYRNAHGSALTGGRPSPAAAGVNVYGGQPSTSGGPLRPRFIAGGDCRRSRWRPVAIVHRSPTVKVICGKNTIFGILSAPLPRISFVRNWANRPGGGPEQQLNIPTSYFLLPHRRPKWQNVGHRINRSAIALALTIAL
jgi:hypothetical protein